MKIKIKVLPALEGDCIFINFGQKGQRKNIMIDGGKGRACEREMQQEILDIENRKEVVDLLIVTHIDDDHIRGILSLFSNPNIDKGLLHKVWFNSASNIAEHFSDIPDPTREINVSLMTNEISVSQGVKLEKILTELGCWESKVIKAMDQYSIAGANITVLSPDAQGLRTLHNHWETECGISTQDVEVSSRVQNDYDSPIEELINLNFEEDDKVPNGSSISILFEYQQKKLLMLGDSHPKVIQNSLESLGYCVSNKLMVEAVKVSHHGSKKNTSNELLGLIDSDNYIISTNGSRHGHPNKECLARIIDNNSRNARKTETNLYFNYDIFGNIFSDDDHGKYKFICKSLVGDNYTLEV